MNQNLFSDEIPDDILVAAAAAVEKILPKKSVEKYENAYKHFIAWMDDKKVSTINETVLLAYFNEFHEIWKPSTLWSRYSMLKSTLNLKKNVDISAFPLLIAFLKQNGQGYKPKKSEVLTAEDVEKFLKTAPDYAYLDVKVALIFGAFGACRACELINLTVDDVRDYNPLFYVTLRDTKNHTDRKFTIDPKYYSVVKKYILLRPKKASNCRFFINYRDGKCTAQNIGINKIAKMPQKIANFLELPHPDCYTGHSFRGTSATLLADAGANVLTLKRHGGWKSDQVAQSYVRESNFNKKAAATMIQKSISHAGNEENEPPLKVPKNTDDEKPVFNFSNCTNCSFTLTKP